MDWKVDAERAVLLVHDMQAYFLKSFPPEQQPVVDLVENAGRLRDTCAARGVPVVYTMQPGDMTVEQRGLLADFWGPGMRAIEDDRKVVEGRPNSRRRHSQEVALQRIHPDGPAAVHAGQRPRPADHLRRLHPRRLPHDSGGSLLHDIQPFLVANATADFSADYHRMALTYAAERIGSVLSTDAVLADLESD